MPGLNGRELADQILSLKPGIKVLYMSGYADNAIVQHGVLTPGLAFIEKPFSPETLAEKVRQVIHSSPPPKNSPPTTLEATASTDLPVV